ncbi:MAG: tRNA pseudouridine(55) synthase TruB [Homoserinimonas sp.]|nr:tRNA pseudouridine(55) synthase TruB [Homoserinimonas sp.]MCW5944770.1 tRNA pseudouridine(55) synthase TruB [Cryobacterium sp.]
MTSHDVVSICRRRFGIRRIGHAGTLDPMATGLLLLGIGPATRLLTFLVGLDKEYLATIRLGASTPSDDADSPADRVAEPGLVAGLTDSQIARAIGKLTGEIAQVPSTFSAIKVDGKRAYARARAGEQVELKPRKVTIHEFELLSSRAEGEFLDLKVRVNCSSGTYIRALARDLGEALEVGGHLTSLRRTRIGPFEVEAASSPDTAELQDSVMNASAAISQIMPALKFDQRQSAELRMGRKAQLSIATAADISDGRAAAIDPQGELIGIVEVESGIARPVMNLPDSGARK